MPVWREHDECPRCGCAALERETWVSTQDFREECAECGYFREATYGYRIAMDLGLVETGMSISELDKLLATLEERHFDTATYPCVREGLIHKTATTAGEYEVIDTWFQSPSDLTRIEIDWLDAQPPGELTLDEAEKSTFKDVIRTIVGEHCPDVAVDEVHIHERLPIKPDETPPIGIMLVTESPEAVFDRLGNRLEQALTHTFGRPVFVVHRRRSRKTDSEDEAS